MSRRGESIWRRKDGRWEARYIKGRNDSGKAVYGSVYGKSYSEVRKKREDIIKMKQQQSQNINTAITFEKVISEFLNEHKATVKISTYMRYTEIIGAHLLPDIGEKQVCEFSQEEANRYVIYLLDHGKSDGTGLAPKSVRNVTAVLKLILKFATKKGYIPANVLTFTVPNQGTAKPRVLSTTQRQKLESFATAENDTYKFGIFLSLYTGLRLGELCALQWRDIDMVNSTISINKTLLRIKDDRPNTKAKTRLVINTPKTHSSKRVIPIPEKLVMMLMQIRDTAVSDCDYVLTGYSKYIEPRSYYKKYKKYLKECGISGFDFHALRHTFATRCVEAGVDPKVLSEILGHASVKITLDLYVHPSEDIKRSAIEKLFASS